MACPLQGSCYTGAGVGERLGAAVGEAVGVVGALVGAEVRSRSCDHTGELNFVPS